MKIYISLPITGCDFGDVDASCIFSAAVIRKKGHEPVSPLEVSPDPESTYAQHMGNDITALLECDAVLFLDGWQYSKGCNLEHEAARIYQKQLYYSLDEIRTIKSQIND